MIVDNHSSFSLLLARESVKDEHLQADRPRLGPGLQRPGRREVRRFKSQPKYEPIVIKEELSPGGPGLRRFAPRFLPGTGADSGAAPPVSAERHAGARHRLHRRNQRSRNWTRRSSPNTNQGDVIGKFGIERQYNDTLMGVDGQRQVVVDNRGQVRQVLATKTGGAGQGPATHHRSGSAGGGGTGHGRQERRGGGARSAHRRGAGHGQPAHVRSQQIRGAHQDQGLERDRRQSRPPAAEPGHSGAAGAGFDVQAHRRRWRAWRPAPSTTSSPCIAPAAWRFTATTTTAGCKTGHGTLALHNGIVHSCDVYFYTVGAKTGDRQHRVLRRPGGVRAATGIDLPHEAVGRDAFASNGSCAITARSGMPERRLRWPSGRAR